MPYYGHLIHFQHPSGSPRPQGWARFPPLRGGSVSERPLDHFQGAAVTRAGALFGRRARRGDAGLSSSG
jgi:hypothetical protein